MAGGNVSFSVLHGLFWMALNVAGDEPMLLVADDLQWCDRPSLRFLAYLAHRLDGTRIGLLAGQRSTEPGVDPSLIAGITAEPTTVVVSPRPLSAGGIADADRAPLRAARRRGVQRRLPAGVGRQSACSSSRR